MSLAAVVHHVMPFVGKTYQIRNLITGSLHDNNGKAEAVADAEDAPAKALLKDMRDLQDEFERAARCDISCRDHPLAPCMHCMQIGKKADENAKLAEKRAARAATRPIDP